MGAQQPPMTNGRYTKLAPTSWVSLGMVAGLLALTFGAYDQVVIPLSTMQQRVRSMSEDIGEIRRSLDKRSEQQSKEIDRMRTRLDAATTDLADLRARVKALEK